MTNKNETRLVAVPGNEISCGWVIKQEVCLGWVAKTALVAELQSWDVIPRASGCSWKV